MILHVEYVTDPEQSPDPIGFLVQTLAQPATIPTLLAGFVVVGLLVFAWARWRPLEAARLRFVERAETYREYIPWIVRLSAGLCSLAPACLEFCSSRGSSRLRWRGSC